MLPALPLPLLYGSVERLLGVGVKKIRFNYSSIPYDIVIAGGGMVGTSLACSLGKSPVLRDKKVLLLEGAPEQSYHLKPQYSNRVSALNPGTKLLLESIGAWHGIESVRYKAVKKMQVWDACSDAMITFNDDKLEKPVAYIVENDVLLAAVNEQLKSSVKNVTVIHNAKIKNYKLPHKEFNLSNQRVTEVQMEDGSLYTCKLLIGADGANSQVRKCMGVQYLSGSYNQMGVVATVKLSEPSENVVAWQRFLPSGPVALLPLTDDLSSLVWSTSIEEAKSLLSLPEENFVDALNDSFWKKFPQDNIVSQATQTMNSFLESMFFVSNAVRQLQPSVSSIEPKSRAAFPLGFGHSTNYVANGVALIGDAAHRVHPLAGQGVNLGFGDVRCLTDILSEAVYNGSDIGNIRYLCKYESIRQKHNIPTMMAIHGLQKLYGSTITPLVLLRSVGLQAVHAIQPIKKAIMNHAAL